MYDIIIIGGGPAGVTAAIYAKRAGLNILILEKNDIGGQMLGSGTIENYPGIVSISGIELSQQFKDHITNLQIKVNYEHVSDVTKQENGFLVTTNKDKYEAKTIIVASGAGPKVLRLPEEDKLVGRGVSYCAYCDANFFAGEDVAVIGGGNSGGEAALYLAKICKKVTLITHLADLTCDMITQDAIRKTKNIELLTLVRPKEFITEKKGLFDLLTGIKYTKDKEEFTVPVSGAFIYAGRGPKTNFLKTGFSHLLDEQGYIKSSDTTTLQEGIYAVGDVRSSFMKQIVTATSDGAQAAGHIIKLLQKK